MERIKDFIRYNVAIDDLQLERIVKLFKRKQVAANTLLLSAGEISGELYFVDQGCLRTYYFTRQGHEKTRYVAFDMSIVTSLSSFISQKPSFEFIDALENSQLYAISHSDFYQLEKEVPVWAAFYKKLLEMAYLYQNKRIESLVSLSAKERYEQLLSESPHFVQRLSNKHLASYLDVRQETLSRLKSK